MTQKIMERTVLPTLRRWAFSRLWPVILAASQTLGGEQVPSKLSASAASSINTGCDPGQGCFRWSARYDGPGHDFDLALAIALSPDNTRIYVTGYSPGIGPYNIDYATIAYDAQTGATIWTARYDSGIQWLD